MESLQKAEYNVIVKTENHGESENVTVKVEPDDESIPTCGLQNSSKFAKTETNLLPKYNVNIKTEPQEHPDESYTHEVMVKVEPYDENDAEPECIQIPECDVNIKTEVQDDSKTNEVMIELEPADGSSQPDKNPKLQEKQTFKQDKATSTENEKQDNITRAETNIVANENKPSQTVCGRKRNYNSKKDSDNRTSDKTYKCEHCDYTSPRNNDLKRHIKIHTGEKPFKCELCDYTCVQSNHLKRHIRTHTGEKPFKCQQCSYICSENRNLKKHMKKAHTEERIFRCPDCNFTCKDNIGLKEHLRNHAGENQYQYQYYPKTQSKQMPEYKVNITKDQSESDVVTIKLEPDDEGSSPDKKPKLQENQNFKQIRTNNIENGRQEVFPRTEINIQVPIENKSSQIVCGRKSKQVLIKNNKKTFTCNDCGKICNRKALLIKHINGHHSGIIKPNEAYLRKQKSICDGNFTGKICEKPLKCQYCNYTCPRKSDLVKHIRTHTGEKPFKCPYCDYTCVQNSRLKRHVRTHTGEKPFKCPYCDFAFTLKCTLKRHVRNHIGEKPYKCQFCNYSSTDNGNLKKHIRTHTGEKPLKCPYCNYTCIENGGLKAHIRTHTGEKPFKCQYCSYTATESSHLKRHIRTHTGEKPFKCEFCEYRCTESGSLKAHIRTHTGEKPFECDKCNKKFAVRSNWRLHLRVHKDAAKIECVEIPEYNESIKKENQVESVTSEVVVKLEPIDDNDEKTESFQMPECNVNIKVEKQGDSDTNEVIEDDERDMPIVP